MAVIVVNEGRLKTLNIVQGYLGASGLVGLFTAPTAPDVTTNLAGVTPATFPGYAAVTPSGWGGAAIDANGNAAQAPSAITFTQNADDTPQDVYGWYLYENAVALFLIKLFDDGPQTFSANGDFRTLNLTAYLGQLAPPL